MVSLVAKIYGLLRIVQYTEETEAAKKGFSLTIYIEQCVKQLADIAMIKSIVVRILRQIAISMLEMGGVWMKILITTFIALCAHDLAEFVVSPSTIHIKDAKIKLNIAICMLKTVPVQWKISKALVHLLAVSATIQNTIMWPLQQPVSFHSQLISSLYWTVLAVCRRAILKR